MADPAIFERFIKRVGLDQTKIIYHTDADEQVIRRIDKGIVFLAAWWSGPAVQALGQFIRAIALLQPRDIEVLVIDVDGAESLCRLPELGQFVTRAIGES